MNNSVLKAKGFLPYILVVFFNAFIDLGHKILIQNTVFNTSSGHGYTILSGILNALMLLPYILLFTPSGFIADRFSKAVVLRITAAVEIPLTILITLFYFLGYFWIAFGCTIFLAIQSALNSPAKYGYIKEMFGKEKIATANAWIQATVIIAILSGIMVFTLLFTHLVGDKLTEIGNNKSLMITYLYPLGFILIGLSITETLLTLRLVRKPAADPQSIYNAKRYLTGHYLKEYLSGVTVNRVTFTCIIGLSIFWGLAQVLLAVYGAYLKTYIPNVTTDFMQGSMAIASIGILLGSIFAGRVSRGFIETGLIPVAAIGITLCLLLLPQTVNKTMIVSTFLAFGFFGGMLVVPLNALIQFNAKNNALGKTLAANNFIQNIFMLTFLSLTVFTTLLGANSLFVLYGLLIIGAAGTAYSFKQLPQALIRFIVYFIISKFYRINVKGLNSIPSTGGVLMLGNHISFLDWAILQIASPRPIRFVMERSIYEKWYLKWFLKRLNMIAISRGGAKAAIKDVQASLKAGDVIAIFPEGYLSRNGQLGAFHSGFERMIEETDAVILPFYLQGLWGSSSSHAAEGLKQRHGRNNKAIQIHFGKPLKGGTTANSLKQTITTLSTQAWSEYINTLNPIAYEWLRAAKRSGSGLCLTDSSGVELNFDKAIAVTYHLSRQLARPLSSETNVGLLLPTMSSSCLTNMAVLCLGKTLVNLNYTADTSALTHAIENAKINTIITSRLFCKILERKKVDVSRLLENKNIIYLEDLKKKTNPIVFSWRYLVTKALPYSILKHIVIDRHDKDSAAAILFSSGSEGTPKGVMLSHHNILSNAKQIACVFNIETNDAVLNSLPLFHAFGLTVSTIMPLIEGIPLVCHSDPTDAVNIGKLCYRYKATVMCATATFLGLYSRNNRLKPPMLASLRFVIAGAEKLSSVIADAFQKKFNVPVFEGYGATETSPVASTNLPDIINPDDWHLHVSNKVGTVGLPLPGTAFRIVDPSTLSPLPENEAGLILIGGPQVMKGYLNNALKTEDVLIYDNNITWYKSGDKGYLDGDGFLTIVDRYSRFAKIGGEMISLSAVEESIFAFLQELEPNSHLMAVAVPDDKRGEKIILLYEASCSETELKEKLLSESISNILLPSAYKKVDALPRLGSGKKDYKTAKEIALL